MKKLLFCSLCDVEKTERILHNYELNGWRLKNVKFSLLFEFVESKPKDVEYIITYDITNDNRKTMYEYEHKLLSEHSANEIPTEFCGIYVYRVTGSNRDFDELKAYRKKYFTHVIFQRMLISIVFFILALFLLFTSYKVKDLFVLKISSIFLTISILVFGYRVYTYIKIKRR